MYLTFSSLTASLNLLVHIIRVDDSRTIAPLKQANAVEIIHDYIPLELVFSKIAFDFTNLLFLLQLSELREH